MLDFVKRPILALQDFFFLTGRALRNIFRSPHYTDDILLQMDIIGVGSLPIVVLTGFFSGAVMALQMSRALALTELPARWPYCRDHAGARTGTGPECTPCRRPERFGNRQRTRIHESHRADRCHARARNGSNSEAGHAAAHRHRGHAAAAHHDSDFVGLVGGFIVSYFMLNITAANTGTAPIRRCWNDLAQGLLKPFVFALVISLVGCFYGMRTSGGTQGVGRATTKAVVVASVWIFVITLFITRIFVDSTINEMADPHRNPSSGLNTFRLRLERPWL